MKKILITIFGIFVFNSCDAQMVFKNNQPTIMPNPVIENYFGVEVVDEYRNLENTQDSIIKKWYQQEGIYADTVLNSISGVDELKVKMREMNNR